MDAQNAAKWAQATLEKTVSEALTMLESKRLTCAEAAEALR